MARLFIDPEDSSNNAAASQQASFCCGCSLHDATITIGLVFVVAGLLGAILSYSFLAVLTHEGTEGSVFWSIICRVSGQVSLLQIVVSVCLMYGGIAGDKAYLVPWIIYASSCATAAGLAIMYCTVALLHGKVMALLAMFVLAVCLGLLVHFLQLVCSYRACLRKRSGHELFVDSDTSSTV